MGEIINGKLISDYINSKNKEYIDNQNEKLHLTVIQVGNNPASNKYIKMKKNACEKVGINFELINLSESIQEKELLDIISKLNKNEKITGIIVQLPLPKSINEQLIISYIDHKKDADGFTPEILGKIMLGDNTIAPATPKGIMSMLDYEKIDLVGKNIVIIGRSNIVGKPLANMLINKQATVTICNSKTKKLASISRSADILIVAIGSGRFITKEYVSKKQIIIDVGANFIDGVYCGDVDFDNVINIVDRITPVPGGVGPMTVCTLIENVINLHKLNK